VESFVHEKSLDDLGGHRRAAANKVWAGSIEGCFDPRRVKIAKRQFWSSAGQNFGNAFCYALVLDRRVKGRVESHLTEETRQKILGALEQALTDLDRWLKRLRLPSAKAIELWDAMVREGNLFVRLIPHIVATTIPLPVEISAPIETFEQAVARFRSLAYSEWLLSLPEPPPERVVEIVKGCKNALPTLRSQFEQAAKAGPQHRRGGRRVLLTDKAKRLEICAEIKRRRGPGVKLEYIFKRLGTKYKVSDTTIKRIWLECPKEDTETNDV
jgi:hypothetical protein